MANDKVRIGVIGAGAIGPSHVFAVDQVDTCELTAVCDVVPEAAERLAKENNVAAFSTVADMLKAGVIDAATLATPSGFHLDTVLEVIKGGVPILVEKPLEITTDRIDQIIAAADEKNGLVACVFQSRFRPVAEKMKELIDGGILGDLYSGSAYTKRYRTQEYYDSGGWRGTWKVDGGGCLMNQGIHNVDLLAWIMGDVEEVIGIIDTPGRNVEVETLALGLIKYTSGAKGVVEGSTVAYPELPNYMEAFGSRGTATFSGSSLMRMDLMDPTPEEAAARDELIAQDKARKAKAAKAPKKVVPAGTPVPDVDMGHTPVVADFIEAIKTGRKPRVDAREGRRSVELITAIYDSGKQGSKPIHLAK